MTSSDVNPSEGPRTEGGGPEKSAVARRRGRSGGVAASLVITGLILVLGFAPVSRLVARDLPQSPPSFAPVVTGSHTERPLLSRTFQ